MLKGFFLFSFSFFLEAEDVPRTNTEKGLAGKEEEKEGKSERPWEKRGRGGCRFVERKRKWK